MKKITFIRHGESTANANGVYAGHLDVGLTTRGQMQAVLAAVQVKQDSVDAIYASPLQRTRHTAQFVAEHTSGHLLTHNDLIERKLGVFEGKPYSKEAMAALNSDASIHQVESLPDLFARAQRVLHWLENNRHSHIVLVSHGSFGRMFEAVMHNKAWQDFHEVAVIPNAKPLVFTL